MPARESKFDMFNGAELKFLELLGRAEHRTMSVEQIRSATARQGLGINPDVLLIRLAEEGVVQVDEGSMVRFASCEYCVLF